MKIGISVNPINFRDYNTTKMLIADVLAIIFGCLNPSQLKTVRLVCKQFKDTATPLLIKSILDRTDVSVNSLFWAIQKKNNQTLFGLLMAGVSPNSVRKDTTALIWATKWQNSSAIAMLLAFGARATNDTMSQLVSIIQTTDLGDKDTWVLRRTDRRDAKASQWLSWRNDRCNKQCYQSGFYYMYGHKWRTCWSSCPIRTFSWDTVAQQYDQRRRRILIWAVDSIRLLLQSGVVPTTDDINTMAAAGPIFQDLLQDMLTALLQAQL